MFHRFIAAFFIALLTVNCSAQPKPQTPKTDGDEDDLGPLISDGGTANLSAEEFRLAVNNALRNKGRKTLVIFEEIDGARCPVEVRTIDTVCRSDAYNSIDPSVVCRKAYTGSNNPNRLDKIVWSSDDGTKFKITFDAQSPCRSGPSDSFQDKQTCKLKKANELGVETGKAGYFKYNIVSEDTTPANPGCNLDPHFIVRN